MQNQRKKKQSPISEMTEEDKKFFLQLLDCLKRYHRQREALFQICQGQLKNWEPVYDVLQNEPEIVRRADQVFAEIYASIEDGKQGSLTRLSKDPLTKWRPN